MFNVGAAFHAAWVADARVTVLPISCWEVDITQILQAASLGVSGLEMSTLLFKTERNTVAVKDPHDQERVLHYMHSVACDYLPDQEYRDLTSEQVGRFLNTTSLH